MTPFLCDRSRNARTMFERASPPSILPNWKRGRFPGLALVLLLTLALITVSTPSEAQDRSYRIAPGDRLVLSVFGQPEFAGEFLVGSEGSVFLPILGEVQLVDLTVQEGQKRVTERLADGYLQQPVVNLRIGEMRPIYVIGDVKTPGSYPFRYGVSVLSAIALAGGFAVPEQAQIGLRTEFLLAEERVRSLESTRRTLVVRLARLQAQRDDTADLTMPADLPDDAGMRALIAAEREILDTQRKALLAELTLLQQQRPRLEAEIAGNRAQREAEQTQLTLIQDHLADYNQLVTNGLARRYTGIELKREEARNKGNLARLSSELARLDLSIGDLMVRVQDVRNGYQRRVITELQEVRSRLAEVETTLPTAREVREARIQQGGTLGLANKNELRRTALITRRRDGKAETIRADSATELAPGDIVEIRRDGRPDDALAASTPLTGTKAAELAGIGRPVTWDAAGAVDGGFERGLPAPTVRR
ncbi:polysaccharide biosynthesis/export family protein [Methylobacterium marchantiae]|uniref:Polysaccharide biosynthesis/export family protein n=1 Tax=Methylobacterium marchantiae TaxID=600331 RepID=A0ABW3X174_9HYPH|nr:hypothetical protein AIGOOFII_3172 [Methylobacterium marchantiae]